ncbi:MAG: glycosyltransferase family 2 protein [Methanomassiliicoccales archaeon]|nr:MAG: glycosyltransferase family 2 protein [Methanomassiliicoccales archaeon]
MKVSVVICTYDTNRLSDTLSSINSVLSQNYNDKEVIVVVDRNKELYNRLKYLIKSPKVTLLLSNNSGLSACRNLARRHVRGGVIAFLDDDAVASKNWLHYLSKCYEDENVLCVGGRINAHPYTPIPDSFPKEMYWIFGCTYKGHPTQKGEVRNTFGSNISFKKRIFNDVGLFDSTFGRVDKKNTTAEETELCVRIRERYPICKIIFEPKAIIYHRVYKSRLSLKYILKRGFGEGYSKAKVNKKFKNKNVLLVESKVLSRIVNQSIPERLKKIMTGQEPINNSKQVIHLFLTSGVVLTGYIIGNITS